LKDLGCSQGEAAPCEDGKKTVEGKRSESDALDVHHPQSSHDCNRVYEEKGGSLKQFPKVINREREAQGLPVHKDLNPVTQQEPEENDCE